MTMNNYTFVTPKRGQDTIATLYPLLANKGYIAGSFSLWAQLDNPNFQPNDVDIFCLDKDLYRVLDQLTDVTHGFYQTQKMVYTGYGDVDGMTLQVIRTTFTSPQEIITNFDLSCSMSVVVGLDTILCHGDTLINQGRIIKINSVPRTLSRMLKYSQRGVKFADSEIFKIIKVARQNPSDAYNMNYGGWLDFVYDDELTDKDAIAF